MRRVEGRESRVESQKRMAALRSGSGPRPSTLDTRLSRSGVTLIELLIVILIISILAALVIGVASVAGETAREAQTRHMIERMHTLLVDHFDTYKTRRVKLRQSLVDAINNLNRTGGDKGQFLAKARLNGLREMMLMEIPDRWSDVLLQSVETYSPGTIMQPFYAPGRTDLSNVYMRQFMGLWGRTNAVTGQTNTAADIKANQGAECLYMVITLACGDGESRTLFAESSIGDTDGDGAPELLDGWGHPINFLRWAPGFESQIQLNALDPKLGKPNDGTWTAAASKDHDPFDVFRVDPQAFRLVPLIFSAGRDEGYGIRTADDFVVWQGLTPSDTQKPPKPDPTSWPSILPWAVDGRIKGTDSLGAALDETATDNVHNHLMGLR